MDPYLGQISAFGFFFTPNGWYPCNGQVVPLNQNQALYALLGTVYGGDGVNTFAIPDLRGRTMIGQGQGNGLSNYSIGQTGGVENVTLLANQMPVHTHTVASNIAPNLSDPVNPAILGKSPKTGSGPNASSVNIYSNAGTNYIQGAPAGGSQAHENRSPYLAINYCIAYNGIFPSRS